MIAGISPYMIKVTAGVVAVGVVAAAIYYLAWGRKVRVITPQKFDPSDWDKIKEYYAKVIITTYPILCIMKHFVGREEGAEAALTSLRDRIQELTKSGWDADRFYEAAEPLLNQVTDQEEAEVMQQLQKR